MRRSMAITFIFVLFPFMVAQADTINIPADYSTIQEGIDAAVNGDTVLVAPGTYVENINFLGKAITVKSSNGAQSTTIDGRNPSNPDFGSVVTFNNNEGLNSVLEGFKLVNGTGTKLVNSHGGAIFCNSGSPTIVNNSITRNVAYDGGAICCHYSSPSIRSNLISDNAAYANGGGICCSLYSFPVIALNAITDNTSAYGGGIYCDESDPEIELNTITVNTADYSGGGIYCGDSDPLITKNAISHNGAISGGGGGIYCIGYSNPNILDNSITWNSASIGGGISCSSSSPHIKRNTITGNAVTGGGGGIYCSDYHATIENNIINLNTADQRGGGISFNTSDSTIRSNIITGNSSDDYGGGIFVSSSFPIMSNNTITGNSAVYGGGIACTKSFPNIQNNTIIWNSADQGGGVLCWYACDLKITNSIIWENDSPIGDELWIGTASHPSTVSVSYSDVKTGDGAFYVDSSCILDWGDGMIEADPLFVDPANDDFHLTYNSPCRDTGDNSGTIELLDFENDPRIAWSGTTDIGADEFYTHLYVTGDLTPGGDIQGKLVGIPGTSPVAVFIGFSVRDPAIHTAYGDFYIKPPFLLVALIPILPNGILPLPTRVPATPAAPYDVPAQGLVGLDPDSLTNLYVIKVR